MPATYHNGACGFSFADGHSEIHKWRHSLAKPRARAVLFTNGADMPALLNPQPGDADIHWLSYHGGTRLRIPIESFRIDL